MDASHVEVDGWLVVMALAAGVVTAVVAALVPAIQAAREKPAEAVRRIPQQPTWRFRLIQVATSSAMLLLGVLFVSLRDRMPLRLGMYAGLGLVTVASLLATPLLTAVAARLLHPIVRGCFGLENVELAVEDGAPRELARRCQPRPMILPLLTSTAPTIGFGEVVP